MDRKLDALLYALTENMTIAVSGEKLARDLGVSHSTLARWVEKLRAAGAEIRGELFTGYRLTRIPDILLPQFIRPRLRTLRLGKTIYHFYSVDSTNAFVSRLIGHGSRIPDGTVVIAETQTAGKGRMGRVWHSARESGLYFSLVLRPAIPSRLVPLLSLAVATALHDAIERLTGLDVDIKWPNDLLTGGRKAAGILAEAHGEIDRVSTVIMGIGVNVNHSEFPPEISSIATSLRMASGRAQSRLELLTVFLELLEPLLTRFETEGPAVIAAEWSSRSSFAQGRRIRVLDGARTLDGVTRGLNNFGALMLQTDTGGVEEIYSGHVIES
jgi:BirA family biotin operon repressor/biotin-[acetyl-CoA-carboxylase] ligase